MKNLINIYEVLVAAFLTLISSGANGQQDFRQVSAESLTFSKAGNWEAAIGSAKRGIESCPQGTAGKECRAVLSYTLGFIEQKQGESTTDPEKARRAFASAQRQYVTSLAEDPENGTVLFNLALLQQNAGASAEAARSLRRAIELDASRAWKYGVRLGDIYAEKNDIPSAWSAYETAAARAPDAETPRWRMVGIMSRSGLSADKLQSLCRSWEVAFSDIAVSCYEQLIKNSYRDNREVAEVSFLAWITLLSDHERLTLESLRVLPNDWIPDVVESVRGILRGTIPGFAPDWWHGPPQRRKAYASLLLFAGHSFASRGPQYVERCWRLGTESVRHLEEQAAGSTMPLSPAVTLNLYQELALLYIRYPDFDPNRLKLNRLVNEIFMQKGRAIASHNLEAEQRFHTVLGMIFVEQKNWGSEGDPSSAAYQLLRVVATADERYKKEGIYQPLPEIKELQARVYSAIDKPEKANDALWAAAIGYMDGDQLNQAAQIMEGIPEDAARDKASLRGIIQLRRQAANGGTGDPAMITSFQSWSTKPGIKADFIRRQQFKALADLVTRSSNVADGSVLQHALDAFDLATKERVALVGAGDLMRWQAVQQKVLNSVGATAKEAPFHPAGAATGTPLKLSLPGNTSPQEVGVPATTLRAAQIARVLGPENLVRMRSRLLYDGNRLSLPSADVPGNARVQERLKAAGIKVVAQ